MAFAYRKATEADRDSYIDFANLVFSMSARPHNFKALLPKVYGDGQKSAHMQTLALDGKGNIRGLVAVMPNVMNVMGTAIRTGYVGTVSVHPYARGEGHMKKLMTMALDEMRAAGCDLTMLGGQRQRYEYFGYTRGGVTHNYTVTATNVRHALSGVDVSGIELRDIHPDDAAALEAACALHNKKLCRGARTPADFYTIAISWEAKPVGVYQAGAFVGYMIVGTNGDDAPITELVLADDALTGAVIKKHLMSTGARSCEVACPAYAAGLRRALARFAEYSVISEGQQLAIFNFPKVVGAFMKLKASYVRLEDGVRSYLIDGQPMTIRVHANEVNVTPDADPAEAAPISALDAQHLFFGADGPLCGESLPMNWGQLPLYLDNPDGF